MKDFQKKKIPNQKAALLTKVRKSAGRKARRRSVLRRVVRTLATVFGVFSVLGGLAYMAQVFLTSPFFEVKEILFEGNAHLSEAKLSAYEERLTENIFRLPLKSIRRDLLEEPYVREAYLRRELPDRVVIRIVERTPFAVMRTKNQFVLVDQDGRVLEALKEKPNEHLPVIAGVGRDAEGIWKKHLEQALSLVEALQSYGYPAMAEVREIEMTKDRGAVLHPSAGGFEILCGFGDFLHKLVLLKRVAGDLVQREWLIQRIDLRFRDQVVVGMKRTV